MKKWKDDLKNDIDDDEGNNRAIQNGENPENSKDVQDEPLNPDGDESAPNESRRKGSADTTKKPGSGGKVAVDRIWAIRWQ